MRRFTTNRWATAAGILVLLGGLIAARPVIPTQEALPGEDRHITLDLRDIDVVDVLKYLARKGGFNIVVSPEVKGRTALFLQDVRVSEALEHVLESQGLAYKRRGGIVYVMTAEEFRTRYGEDYSSPRQSRSMRLQYVDPARLLPLLQPLKSARGSIVTDGRTGSLLLVDTPDRLEALSDAVRKFDLPSETRVFDLRYAKAAEVRDTLLAQAGAHDLVSIQADVRSNQILVTAPPARLSEISRLVGSLDRKTREVAIDARILRVIFNDNYDKGVDWRYLFKRGFLESLDFNVNLPRSLTSFGSVGFGTISNDNFEAVFNFLKSLGQSKILASPRLTVVEGGEAKILIGTREAYVTTTTTTTGVGVSNTAESVSFIDVGVSLRVSPQINRDGYVTMTVRPEVSSVARTLITPSDSQIPILDTTQAESRVMVKDGATIVIGGLRKDEKVSRVDRVPWLSDLPLLGGLFRNNSEHLEQSEIIVFLTPHVLKNGTDFLEDRLSDMKGIRDYAAQLGTLGLPPGPPPAAAETGASPQDSLAFKGPAGYGRKG
ncbi:MAG TPA: secretin N-terminal domain-containing protein [Candidatus Eisenbacteria bacterium]|jgi:type II secretory pathway component GspD/PulD (secretin)|nr:secretin N-terminal domain-containing protein [Candidatus Eisenbacteria bacterium]